MFIRKKITAHTEHLTPTNRLRKQSIAYSVETSTHVDRPYQILPPFSIDFLSYGLTIRLIHFLKKIYHIICFVNKEN
jgi:hypothetical protein